MTASLPLPPLSLYIHIPWCVRKCPYCDFNSHQADDTLPEADYVAALRADLEHDRPLAQGRPLQTVFFGGGTPSLLSAQAIGQILEDVNRIIGLAPEAEITLEANPGTFEQERFSGFRAAGVNRLSIGIQSFNEQQLHRLGRIHGRAEALAAVAVARKAGFDNLNLDLMHGLPGQTPEDAYADLAQAIDLAPEHLSWYQLTIEPNTEFYNSPPVLPEEDSLADIQSRGEAQLAEAGFEQYEVSAYARPNQQARHNLNYWTFGDYLGIGAGAHGKITRPESGQIMRLWKTRLPKHYLNKCRDKRDPGDQSDRIASSEASDESQTPHNPFVAGREFLGAEALPLDFMLNALRLNAGVAAGTFTERTGLPLSALEPQWQALRDKGLVDDQRTHLRTTDLGRRFLNDVLAQF
ncbi:radical SAM family heme chaperone HemW [Marinimicrobium sp. C2-29]|uniref:radical SAM family heme chaperone HemW n=1 Tax=Marinimicrobium sp. C2-29 TaxID=3139825 RepID=UPI00313A44D8